jgi:hypothetical protein
MTGLVRIGCRAYGLLLALYPRELRQRYGAEIALVFREQMGSEFERRGLGGVAGVWLTAGWEIVRVALPLQLTNPALIAAALSFVSASMLTLAFFRAVSPK